jgi:hypothetical protein
VAARALHELLARDSAAIMAADMADVAATEESLRRAAGGGAAGAGGDASSGADAVAAARDAALYRRAEDTVAWRYFDRHGCGHIPFRSLQLVLRHCGLRLSPAAISKLLRAAAGGPVSDDDGLEWVALLDDLQQKRQRSGEQ